MKLTVLGCSAPFPLDKGGCPGYLVEGPGGQVLLEAGPGTLSSLGSVRAYASVAAVVLSHLHADHMSDFLVLRYALEAVHHLGLRSEPLVVYAPAEPAALFSVLPYRQVVRAEPLDESRRVEAGGLSLSFLRTQHPVPCYAVRFEERGKGLVYTADTSWAESLVGFAHGADLLLAEATLMEREAALGGQTGHLTAGQAGRLGAEAGVRRLVITHLVPFYDADALRREAEDGFGGPVEVARPGLEVEL
ncbi:MAG: MBL fold metallo-hydrolase [Acetobacteraceae bacterium]|nr:MBL fold metallo-hydrolase [Acetobacteraceae bacterium]